MSNGKPGAPGIGKDGAAGVRVQVILSVETVAVLDAWRGEIARGPAVRQIVERFSERTAANRTHLPAVDVSSGGEGEPLQCPFCGYPAKTWGTAKLVPTKVLLCRVACTECGAMSGNFHERSEAIAAWNTRWGAFTQNIPLTSANEEKTLRKHGNEEANAEGRGAMAGRSGEAAPGEAARDRPHDALDVPASATRPASQDDAAEDSGKV